MAVRTANRGVGKQCHGSYASPEGFAMVTLLMFIVIIMALMLVSCIRLN